MVVEAQGTYVQSKSMRNRGLYEWLSILAVRWFDVTMVPLICEFETHINRNCSLGAATKMNILPSIVGIYDISFGEFAMNPWMKLDGIDMFAY